jgi:ribosomal protein S18 acetylase RimI-like enzyme
MRAVDHSAVELGGRTLWLGVWERNPRAIAFYAKCGFVDVGEHAFIFGTEEQTDRVMARAPQG